MGRRLLAQCHADLDPTTDAAPPGTTRKKLIRACRELKAELEALDEAMAATDDGEGEGAAMGAAMGDGKGEDEGEDMVTTNTGGGDGGVGSANGELDQPELKRARTDEGAGGK